MLVRLYNWFGEANKRELLLNLGTMIYELPRTPDDAMNAWVGKIRERSGQPIDWFASGEDCSIYYLGDRAKVREAIKHYMEENPCWAGVPLDDRRYRDPGGFLVTYTQIDLGLFVIKY